MPRMILLCVASLFVSFNCISGAAQTASHSKPANESKTVWVRYEDLAEHAFAFEAPQSWEVKGGSYRFGYFDVRWMIDVRSPDSKMLLRLNDANVPSYVLPSMYTPREGQRYDKPGQFQMVVAGYQEAQAYADAYAKSRFDNVCREMKAQPSSWHPTLPSAFHEDTPAQESEGTVAYTCSSPDGPRVALVYARTTLYRGANQANFWTIAPVMSALVTPENVANVEAIATHMLNSVEKNPQWVLYQKQIEQAGLQNVQRNFQIFMQQMQQYHNARTQAWNQQVQGFEARQQASFQQSSSWCDTMTGLTNATDPLTGQKLQVWTGPNANYYINGLGVTVNANTSPGPGFNQLDTRPETNRPY
jgi:hypothetical protein